ncbi:sensor histidine kinase [Actinomadura macrotermitis]|uniref:sensor histidine kinase n=1 Tax=Actinomadura macrotermitis TaxID=2585200 RepID=UPI001294FF30|nr:histidine kinase [Actinomadura macrotermitis]
MAAESGPGPDPRDVLFAALLRESCGELAGEFGRALLELGGFFASSAEARRQAQGQLERAVGDTADALSGRRGEPPGMELSWEIGMDRARQRIPQAESLAAAGVLHRTVAGWALARAEADERLRGYSLNRFLAEFGDALIRRVAEAHTWYAGHLLNEIHHAHRAERARIARDLHDQVGHAVVEARLGFAACRALREADPERAERELARLGGLLDAALAAVHTMIGDLRTEVADLGRALKALAADASRSGAAVNVEVNGDEGLLPPQARTEVFLILREAVLNAVRHAAAAAISVVVDVAPSQLSAVVDDDGRGIGPERPAAPGGHGIAGMRERAALLDGGLTVARRRGGGTRVTLLVPLAVRAGE